MRFCKHTNGIGKHTQLKYLSLYSIITPNIMKFENIMENEAFALLEQMLHFHIFKHIQNFTNFFS